MGQEITGETFVIIMNLANYRPFSWLKHEGLGFLIQAVIISILVTIYFLIGFYWTDVGLNLIEGFAGGLAAASVIGIAFWAAIVFCWIIFIYCGHLDDAYADEDDLIYISLVHILYTLIRWPIFFGIAASNIPGLIVFGFWVDLIIVIIALSITGLVHLIKEYKERQSKKKEIKKIKENMKKQEKNETISV